MDAPDEHVTDVEEPDGQERDDGSERLCAFVRGQVQGVGFRWWVRSRALALGLRGWARNLPDGRVEVVAQGRPQDVRALLDLLQGGAGAASGDEGGPRRPGRVAGVSHHLLEPVALPDGFEER
ncbi:acylphosphatase [Thalassiella azotivora]